MQRTPTPAPLSEQPAAHDDIQAFKQALEPPTLAQIATGLRAWADVLDIPSGPFVNDDLRQAATALEAAMARIADLTRERDERRVALLSASKDGKK